MARIKTDKALHRGKDATGERKPSILATSEAARRAHAERRGEPLILGKDVKAFGVVRMAYRDLVKLKIDTSYQREEITDKVNELIHVLRSGGQIADPITVAERTDGSRYLVDGQQRWWAAIDTEMPLEVKLLKVPDYENERKLFHILNNQASLGSATVIRSWPGPLGDLLHRLNDQRES